MANEKLITLDLLSAFQQSTKNYIDTEDAKSIKNAKYANNVLSLYTTEDTTGTAAVTLDLPEEMFLDQSKTKFIQNFTWSDELYPGSTNPNLEGKGVLVLAVKGDTSVTYSFISLDAIVTIYTGTATSTATTTVSGDEISVAVKVSAEADNGIVVKADGVYAPASPTLEYATSAEVAALWN